MISLKQIFKIANLSFLKFFLASSNGYSISTESVIEKINLNICGSLPTNCLEITAASGESSQFQSTMSLSTPSVHGLGFNDKTFSSAILDFIGSTIYLRERKNGIYLGEWLINMDNLNVSFFPVPK